MYNVLNTHSTGGQRTGRHWQSSGDDLGLHGDIVGYHDADKIPSSYTDYTSYNAFKICQVYRATYEDPNTAIVIQAINIKIHPPVFDTARNWFYSDYEIDFPISVNPANPSTIISTSEYCKIRFRIYTLLQRGGNDPTAADYYRISPQYRQYDPDADLFSNLQSVYLYNYHSLADLENDNYYEYYNRVGVNYYETLPERRATYFFISLASLYQSILYRIVNRSDPYGGYFEIRNDVLNISKGYNYGVTASDPATKWGYIKYKNAVIYNYKISPSYSLIPSVPTAYTYMDIYDATIYGKGRLYNDPATLITLPDTKDIIVIPNTTRDYIYT